MKKLLYMAMSVKKEITVTVLGIDQKMPLVFAKGMYGCIPVFETEDEAREYSGNGEVQKLVIEVGK